MPKSKLKLSTIMDLSSLYNVAKKKAKSSSISQSNASPVHAPTLSQSEEGSPMEIASKKAKAKKTPQELASERFSAALKKATDYAKAQINAELLRTVLKDRVKSELAAEYGPGMPVAEIDKHAANAARQLAYELREISVLPPELMGVAVSHLGVDPKHYTAEPKDQEAEDFDD